MSDSQQSVEVRLQFCHGYYFMDGSLVCPSQYSSAIKLTETNDTIYICIKVVL